MILRTLIVSALILVQDPPKPPEPGTPPAAATPVQDLELKIETLKKVTADGVTLTGDFYSGPFDANDRPTFVCFHMENGSRAEFAKIAPSFANFSCSTFAVDLRTGKATDGVPNETALSAASVHKKSAFTNEEAFADVVEALKWAREMRPAGKIFALGSGTSAALVLVAAGRDPACADAVFVFSPAEDVTGWSVAMESKKIAVPTFVTCDGTPQESSRARMIGNAIDKKLRVMVIPTGVPGATRGASILVQTDKALHDRHWMTMTKLLLQHAPVSPTKPAETPLKKV